MSLFWKEEMGISFGLKHFWSWEHFFTPLPSPHPLFFDRWWKVSEEKYKSNKSLAGQPRNTSDLPCRRWLYNLWLVYFKADWGYLHDGRADKIKNRNLSFFTSVQCSHPHHAAHDGRANNLSAWLMALYYLRLICLYRQYVFCCFYSFLFKFMCHIMGFWKYSCWLTTRRVTLEFFYRQKWVIFRTYLCNKYTLHYF